MAPTERTKQTGDFTGAEKAEKGFMWDKMIHAATLKW